MSEVLVSWTLKLTDQVIAAYADDVVMLPTLRPDLQCALGRFWCTCELAGMRISTSASPWLSAGKKWFALSGTVQRPCHKWRSSSITGPCSWVSERWTAQHLQWCSCCQSKGAAERNWKAKPSIYRPINVPTLTHGHELLVMSETTISLIQVARMSFHLDSSL